MRFEQANVPHPRARASAIRGAWPEGSGISQDSPNITSSFARRYGITFPILVEGDDYPVSKAFDIQATPTVFLIEGDGDVTFVTMGFLKPGIDDLGDAAADAVGFSHEPLITAADAEIPNFVPG